MFSVNWRVDPSLLIVEVRYNVMFASSRHRLDSSPCTLTIITLVCVCVCVCVCACVRVCAHIYIYIRVCMSVYL